MVEPGLTLADEVVAALQPGHLGLQRGVLGGQLFQLVAQHRRLAAQLSDGDTESEQLKFVGQLPRSIQLAPHLLQGGTLLIQLRAQILGLLQHWMAVGGQNQCQRAGQPILPGAHRNGRCSHEVIGEPV